jgi:hypothetical protein
MTYTINGKPYTEFDINKRCAELMGFEVLDEKALASKQHESFRQDTLNNCWIVPVTQAASYKKSARYSPCTWIADTWPIIEKCWDELFDYTNDAGLKPISYEDIFWTKWESLKNKHNCTKLVAACICLIELNE